MSILIDTAQCKTGLQAFDVLYLKLERERVEKKLIEERAKKEIEKKAKENVKKYKIIIIEIPLAKKYSAHFPSEPVTLQLAPPNEKTIISASTQIVSPLLSNNKLLCLSQPFH